MSLVRSIGLKFDHGVYEGSGSAPEIRGLKNVTGIQTVSMGTNGAALANLDPFADALGSLEDYSAASDEAVFVMSPRTARAVAKLKEQPTGNNKPLVVPEGRAGAPAMTIYGGPVYVSAQLSVAETQGTANNASSVYCYVPSEVVAVMRQDVRVERDSSRLFNSDQSELRAIMRSDVVVPNPKAVVRVLGIIP
jgi:HK97 family phage major capsid protein